MRVHTWICMRIYRIWHCNTHCNTLQHTATHCNTLQHRCGSPGYVAPEIIKEKDGYGLGVDMWSMGLSFFIPVSPFPPPFFFLFLFGSSPHVLHSCVWWSACVCVRLILTCKVWVFFLFFHLFLFRSASHDSQMRVNACVCVCVCSIRYWHVGHGFSKIYTYICIFIYLRIYMCRGDFVHLHFAM